MSVKKNKSLAVAVAVAVAVANYLDIISLRLSYRLNGKTI